ncbi:30S ribosomal protein S5 [Patescibacteria group bacterium]|nr:30S ribosomal protein S5 [Patescibacteria group bacterium]
MYKRPEEKEFAERVLEINRVTRVVKGGKRMRFRALVVIGDGKGKVGWGMGKAGDVSTAITKASTSAKRRLVILPIKHSTIPYPVLHTYKSAQVLIKPASVGTGIIAGGVVRIVLQLAGVKDAVAKMMGSQNKTSNAIATIDALNSLTSVKEIKRIRSLKE